MNIEQAKAIPISVILDKMNLTPQRTSGDKTLFFSPFRNERTASFWVDTQKSVASRCRSCHNTSSRPLYSTRGRACAFIRYPCARIRKDMSYETRGSRAASVASTSPLYSARSRSLTASTYSNGLLISCQSLRSRTDAF